MNKLQEAAIWVTVALLLVGAVFTLAVEGFKTIDTSTLPSVIADAIITVRTVFSGGVIAVFVTWIANLTGYAWNWLDNRLAQESAATIIDLEYKWTKLAKTFTYYLGGSIIFIALLPDPWRNVFLAFQFVIQLVLSNLNRVAALFQKAKTKGK